MKNTILLSILLLISTFTFAQKEVAIEFISETEVTLNGVGINTSTTFEDITKMLGEPVIYKEYLTGKTNYHYKDLGLAVHTLNGKLLFIGANYNWDGDKTFPQTSFTGTMIVDGVSFNNKANEEMMAGINNVEFLTMMPGFYISKPLTDVKKTFAVIGFEKDLVTQVGFEFH